jgi:sugar O-acyltransferase (sialic acid O-acetyltransferase NeuD family)
VTDLIPVAVYGSGGHGKVVADILICQGTHRVAYFVDDDASKAGTRIWGYPVLHGMDGLLRARDEIPALAAVVAIGCNESRESLAARLVAEGVPLITAIHPAACVAASARIGAGTVFMAGSIVNPSSTIGSNTIVNTRSAVDHDCQIGDSVHIAPGATICGHVTIGDLATVWAGATVINNIAIGAGAIVGAGAVVTHDVPPGLTVVGVPARPLPRGAT